MSGMMMMMLDGIFVLGWIWRLAVAVAAVCAWRRGGRERRGTAWHGKIWRMVMKILALGRAGWRGALLGWLGQRDGTLHATSHIPHPTSHITG